MWRLTSRSRSEFAVKPTASRKRTGSLTLIADEGLHMRAAPNRISAAERQNGQGRGPIVEKGCRIAAAMLEVAEAEVEFARRRFVVKGTDRSVGLFEAAAAALADDLPPDLRGPLIGIPIRS
jgi:hypothetical protein